MSSSFESIEQVQKPFSKRVAQELCADTKQANNVLTYNLASEMNPPASTPALVQLEKNSFSDVDRKAHIYVDPGTTIVKQEFQCAARSEGEHANPVPAKTIEGEIGSRNALPEALATATAARTARRETDAAQSRKVDVAVARPAVPAASTSLASQFTPMLFSISKAAIQAYKGQAAVRDYIGGKIIDAFDFVPPLSFSEAAIKLGSMIPGNEKEGTRYEQAKPGYKLEFPRDEASHDKYKSEWWYYVGHLKDDQGHKYGYELTFFRHKLFGNDYYSAHLALSDIDGQRFQWKERSSTLHPFTAGASTKIFYVWNGDWRGFENPDGSHHLSAGTKEFSIELDLSTLGKPVVHGADGVSKKADGNGKATYYYSRTRMPTEGTITDHGKRLHVRGNSWMDHEIGSNIMGEKAAGWDWYSVQLDDNSDLMLCIIRNDDGTIEKNSFGTIIGTDGSVRHLKGEDFIIKSTGAWRSPATNTQYPMGWTVSIPSADIQLDIQPALKNQELDAERSTGMTYWEGKCTVSGSIGGKPVKGDSYVELAGYKQKLSKFSDPLKP